MANFTNHPIKDTYYRVVQLDDGGQIQNGLGHPLSGSLRISGSVHITGSSTVGGDLAVTGKVTASEFIATTVSSSILFESGSSQFGNSLDDVHKFTGSVDISSSLNIDGSFISTGSFNHTGSINLLSSGSLTHTGSINVSGSITAQNTITAERGAFAGLFMNPNIIEENINIPANRNAGYFGPTITIGSGITMTVGAGSTLTIL